MLEALYNYSNVLENLQSWIDNSSMKKEYFLSELNLSRSTFYDKLKKKNFTMDELLKLGTILFPDEAKAFEIKQSLEQGYLDIKKGKVKEHSLIMSDMRNRVNKWKK